MKMKSCADSPLLGHKALAGKLLLAVPGAMAGVANAPPCPPRSPPVTLSFLSLRIMVVAGSVAIVACGPRLKPVEYEEPKNAGNGSIDDPEPSSGHKSKSSSSGETSGSASSGEGSSSHKGPFKSCDDKANACGAPCTECAPGNQDCMEVLISKQCNVEHKCVAAPVDCTVAEKANKKDSKKK